MVNVQIQTTSACNGKCKICPYVGSWHHKNPGTMSWEVYTKIIDELEQYEVGKLCLYLENEPLLDDGLFHKIEYAAKYLKFDLLEISTNLSALTESKLDKIKEIFPKIPHEIWVSFHGVSKKTYEDIMGLDFDKALKNTLLLINAAQEVPLNIMIRGSGIPRYKRVSKGVGTFTKQEFDYFWKCNFTQINGSLEYYHELHKDVFALLTRPNKNYVEPRLEYYTYHDRAGNSSKIEFHMRRASLTNANCPRFSNWMHFLYTGEPVLCCMDYHKETGFGETIETKSIKELYSSYRFNKLVSMGMGLIESDPNFICRRCVSPGG